MLVDEHDQIVEAINRYIKGEIEADADVMASAFYDSASIHGAFGGTLWGGPIEMLFEATRQGQPNPEMQARIDILDVHGTCAVARVMLEGGDGPDFVDYHSLVKSDGQWKIAAKVFHPIMGE